MKILAPAKEEDAEPRGKNKRMALEAAKGGDKPKGGKPKAEAAEGGEAEAKRQGRMRDACVGRPLTGYKFAIAVPI